jgi:hypothetical protein
LALLGAWGGVGDNLGFDNEAGVELGQVAEVSDSARPFAHTANPRRPDTPACRLYTQVGLYEGCADFLLLAARKAYRTALPPDGQSEQHRVEAEHQFKQAEAVFAEIERLHAL